MIQLFEGDCLDVLKTLEENSVDSIVTDPPYELGFMGKSWDNTGIANSKEMWREAMRVLKPGGHLLAFSGTRTYHRMAVAIEDAGFEVRDMIEWVYGSGFPKSRNIGLDVDKRNGVTKNRGKAFVVAGQSGQRDKDTGGDLVPGSNTMGAYVAQNEWSGWGTALKPAHEPICMARKPLAEKTVAENCLKWGTGGINVDESRVGTEVLPEAPYGNRDGAVTSGTGKGGGNSSGGFNLGTGGTTPERIGRFPANLIHDNSEEVRECFPESKGGAFPKTHGSSGFVSPEEKESRLEMNDSGNASRFFKSIIYQAKASKSERNKGCEDLEEKDSTARQVSSEWKVDNRHPDGGYETAPQTKATNNHPTVKPIALMEYLIKMVTPTDGTVLDPFMGSGSTGVAAKQNSYSFIGIDMTPEYVEIARARIESVL